jgi:hypothetical protein
LRHLAAQRLRRSGRGAWYLMLWDVAAKQVNPRSMPILP